MAFDNGVQEWNSFDQEGWTSRLATTKGITITASGKRNVGDAGNDFIAGLAFKNGRDLYTDFKWTFPDGTAVEFTNAVINVTSNGSGETGDVAPLEFEVIDITEKLNFDEKPKIKIKDKTFEVNDSAVTMLKILPSLEDLTPSKLYDFFELLFNEKDRKAIEKMNLNLEDFSQVIMSAVELVAGTVEDNEGETVTPATT